MALAETDFDKAREREQKTIRETKDELGKLSQLLAETAEGHHRFEYDPTTGGWTNTQFTYISVDWQTGAIEVSLAGPGPMRESGVLALQELADERNINVVFQNSGRSSFTYLEDNEPTRGSGAVRKFGDPAPAYT